MIALEAKIATLRGLGVVVGVTAKTNGRSSEFSNAELAAIHEFGSPARHIPERSFLRKPLISNAAAIANLAKNAVGKFITGQITAEAALGALGEEAKNISKVAITEGIAPALKPATIKRKKSSKPLIDTGQLLNSITYEVRK
ncbi:hypothetical protein [Campylobacter showae]|uniref:Uncharacterized protein n=1 Tax=Campylobacter showae CC57C TaxID=1073353 RepID=M3I4P7_9BACT|nr:hypothetical protein [Campylobacter showae]EMG31569.1 hypothetical protein H740_00522 [Campylobacter showae CC57C]